MAPLACGPSGDDEMFLDVEFSTAPAIKPSRRRRSRRTDGPIARKDRLWPPNYQGPRTPSRWRVRWFAGFRGTFAAIPATWPAPGGLRAIWVATPARRRFRAAPADKARADEAHCSYRRALRNCSASEGSPDRNPQWRRRADADPRGRRPGRANFRRCGGPTRSNARARLRLRPDDQGFEVSGRGRKAVGDAAERARRLFGPAARPPWNGRSSRATRPIAREFPGSCCPVSARREVALRAHLCLKSNAGHPCIGSRTRTSRLSGFISGDER